MEKHI